jgi:Uma2 family endonuclease
VPAVREIVVPETEPATEWILGRAVQKVSPRRTHAILQLALGGQLSAWAAGRGEAGSEWRFGITPPGDITRPLVPDLAYISYERLRGLTDEQREAPNLAPDIAIEIRSPGDRQQHVEHKRDVYIAAGVKLLLIVDPMLRSLDAYEAGTHRTLLDPSTFSSEVFPGLTLSLADAFAKLDIPR